MPESAVPCLCFPDFPRYINQKILLYFAIESRIQMYFSLKEMTCLPQWNWNSSTWLKTKYNIAHRSPLRIVSSQSPTAFVKCKWNPLKKVPTWLQKHKTGKDSKAILYYFSPCANAGPTSLLEFIQERLNKMTPHFQRQSATVLHLFCHYNDFNRLQKNTRWNLIGTNTGCYIWHG